MKNNHALQTDVQNAPKRAPLLNAAEIGVIAKDGAISPQGVLGSYASKLEAEKTTKKLVGSKNRIPKKME